jgi:hypothetical protein
VSRQAVTLAAIVLALVGANADASTSLSVRIYDPTGRETPSLTTADVIRTSARATRAPGAQGVLYIRLTRNGARKFRLLTRALARLGAREHRLESLAFSVSGRVYSRARIDYRAFPDGLPGDQGIEFDLALTTAQRLARLIRSG